MKRMKNVLFIVTAGLLTPLVSSCSGSSGATITLWVGDESVDFYQDVCNKYAEEHPDFGYNVKVDGTDLGSIAGTILKDSSACADIYSVAHDNIGKLVAHGDAKPIITEDMYGVEASQIAKDLKDQITADTSEEMMKVCYSDVDFYTDMNHKDKDHVEKKNVLCAVPYISQALFLMYDKRYVTPEQAQSFETLKDAAVARTAARKAAEGATAPEVKAVNVTGTDTFNFSFPFLARENSTKATTVKIYEDFDALKTYNQGDDQVAIYRWLQDYAADPNGFDLEPSDSGFDGDVRAGNTLAVIGGSWKYKAVVSAVDGENNIGLAPIPTFTIQPAHACGTDGAAGKVFRGGTFGDCKVFMVNSHSQGGEKYVKILELIKHLSSRDVQKQSFTHCLNTPVYKGFADDLNSIVEEYNKTVPDDKKLGEAVVELGKVQAQMMEFSIPQPINSAKLNNYFYQKGADSIYKLLVNNKDNAYGTERKVREALYSVNYTWCTGKKVADADIPADLPAVIK